MLPARTVISSHIFGQIYSIKFGVIYFLCSFAFHLKFDEHLRDVFAGNFGISLVVVQIQQAAKKRGHLFGVLNFSPTHIHIICGVRNCQTVTRRIQNFPSRSGEGKVTRPLVGRPNLKLLAIYYLHNKKPDAQAQDNKKKHQKHRFDAFLKRMKGVRSLHLTSKQPS